MNSADDQFFPMGDNSPQSSDARMWPKHFFRTGNVDWTRIVDLLAASLVSPHSVYAQRETHAIDPLSPRWSVETAVARRVKEDPR